MKEIRDINMLAIESSCDETAAAVVHNGREVLSNIISSQIDLHKLYGGVVPEIASRKHIEKINQVIEEALKEADVTLDDIDAVAVTYGPGLVGALLVGVAEAKAISQKHAIVACTQMSPAGMKKATPASAAPTRACMDSTHQRLDLSRSTTGLHRGLMVHGR